jgi:hypothetical protein
MPRSLRYREVIRRLKAHDPRFEVLMKRGKGSECLIVHPDIDGQHKSIPLKHHGDGTDIYVGALLAIARRFNLSKDFFN